MKTLVLASLIAIASTGSTFANQSTTSIPDHYKNRMETVNLSKKVDDLESQIEFHQRNIAIFWNQYDLMVARIQNSKGNRVELESDKDYFVNVHKQNIQKGVAIEESKKAIEQIEKKFQKELAKREAYEAKEIARMQGSLKEALTLEQRKVDRLRTKNEKSANHDILVKLQELDRYCSQSIQRLVDLQQNSYRISIASEK